METVLLNGWLFVGLLGASHYLLGFDGPGLGKRAIAIPFLMVSLAAAYPLWVYVKRPVQSKD